ncbi:hypothetical protein EDB19DRAFT_1828425 [Suillus lakei]|nr:hypothetical protein EDB19DRAFT_1828425 [Suillus lakei]
MVSLQQGGHVGIHFKSDKLAEGCRKLADEEDVGISEMWFKTKKKGLLKLSFGKQVANTCGNLAELRVSESFPTSDSHFVLSPVNVDRDKANAELAKTRKGQKQEDYHSQLSAMIGTVQLFVNRDGPCPRRAWSFMICDHMTLIPLVSTPHGLLCEIQSVPQTLVTGCDNCQGDVSDVKARVQTYKDRLNISGFDRTKYWNTTATGLQWAAMRFTSFTHGAIANDIETIKGTAIYLNVIITDVVQPFIADPNASFASYDYQDGLRYNGTAYLLIVANLGNAQVHVPWNEIGLPITTNATTQLQRILFIDSNTNVTGRRF